MKKILFIATLLASWLPFSTAHAADVEIGTVEQLKAFRDAVNSGNQYSDKTVVLTADLDLSGETNWKPIGNLVSYPGQSFNGVFDGQDHTISNLTVNDNTPNYAVAGLFGSVVNGTIKNLTVKNVDIKSTHYAGGIVAYTSNTPSIINCHVIGGTISSTPELLASGSYDNGDKVGGIMGYATAGSKITNCSVKDVTITAYRDMGGIVGYSSGTVTNNTVTNVTVTQDLTNGYKNPTPTTFGDVIGRNEGATLSDNEVVESNGVAQIGTTMYETLEAAFAAAEDGQTITLLADCAGNGIKVPQGKYTTGLTVDFAGHTYTINGATVGSTGTKTQAFQLLKDNTIAFRNGTIIADNVDVKMMIQNYSNLMLDGMTLDATQGTNSVGYVLSTNNGTTVINNTTITAKSTGVAFDVDSGWGNYASNSVEVTGTSVINGNIEVAFEGKTEGTPSVLKLTSGTLNGNIVMGTGAEECTVTKANDFVAAAPEGYTWQDNGDGTYSVKPVTYVAQIGTTKYETLQAAIDAAEAENTPNIVIDLLDDAELTIAAWSGTSNKYAIGTAQTESITINGNGHKLTFMTTDTDWNNVATMNDAVTKLTLNNMTIDQGGRNTNETWNAYDINFNCAVELNNVTSNRPLAFKNDATLNNVTVNASGDFYAIWVSPRTEGGQTISINGLNVTCGRGIKIDDQYVSAPVPTTLEIENATFTTSKKSAILVKTAGGADITVGEHVNIANVAADPNNIVWVDEDNADKYYNVTVTGASLIPEGGEVHYVASLVRGEQTRGYYTTFAEAYNSTDFEDGDTYKLLKTTTEAVEVAKALTIVKNGFTAANLTAVEGFKKTETDEAITFVAVDPVCEIAGVQYYTLAAAVSAAQTAGGVQTITLLSDVGPETVTIEEDANFQLTIDGKKDETTNYSVEALIIVDGKRGNGGSNTNGASVTLQNIAFVNNQAQNVITAQHYPHHLTIQDCTYQGSAASLNNWFLNISDGPLYGVTVKNVTAENTRLIQGKLGLEAVFEDIVATSDIKAGLNVNVAGTLLVKNCQITTGKYAFRDATEAYTGIITLEGNTFISTSTEADEGAIVNRGGQNGVGQINVVSGTYTGEIRELNGHTLLNITGGTFSQDVTDYVAEGYMVKNLGNGTYTVIKAVAQIGTTMYETLEAAFAAAEDGQTITLLADCAGNGIKVPQGKFTTGLTVDFAGHTYTVDGETVGSTGTETNGFQLLKGNKLTFKGGTITSTKAKILVQNYSNLTLEGMTLTLANDDYASGYTLSNNNGNVVIDGSTINANTGGGFAFDVCRYSSYTSVNVEVKGESVINGDIEIYASGSDAKDGFGLTLTAGTLTGEIVIDPTAAAAMKETPEKATVTKADDFDVDAPEGYIWQSNGDGTSKLDMPTVSVGSKGFATFSSTYPLDFTDVENIYAYIALIKDGEVTYKRIRKVPAGTGLLLRNPAGTSDKAKVPVLASTDTDDTDGTTDSTEGNRFVAVPVTIDALPTAGDGVTNYILNSNGAHGVGFYQANGKKVAAGKAYLAIPTGTPVLVKALVFDEDDATGIAEVESFDEGTQATYNLAGQRVPARSAQKGIYIVNGKKIIK